MPTRKGFVQGYNTQVAVTADQVIVAVAVGQATTDQASFVPTGTPPRKQPRGCMRTPAATSTS